MANFLKIFYDFLTDIPTLWTWLITPNPNFLDMAPILMILGSTAIIVGIVKAIISIF